MTLISRLHQYLEQENIPVTRLEKKSGVSQGTIAKAIRGNTHLGSDKIEKICQTYPDLNPNWLITGEGEMKRPPKDSSVVREPQAEYRKSGIPLVSIEALAGLNSSSFNIARKDIMDHYIIPDFKAVDFMIRVTGKSMEPSYSSGDIVACRVIKEKRFIQWGKVHLIATKSQGIILKRLKPGKSTDFYECISDNSDFPSFQLPINEELEGLAMVIGTIRLE